MTLVRSAVVQKDTYTVLVHPNELVVESGKSYPFCTTIGTFNVKTGELSVWNPCGYVPRGYKAAALALLQKECASHSQRLTEG